MEVIERIRGVVRAELFGAYPESLLNAAAGAGIELWELNSPGENCVRFSCYERSLEQLDALAKRCGCELTLLRRRGGSLLRSFLLRRTVLLGGALLALGLMLLSSLFVWSVEVRGAERVSRGEILRALEDAGLTVGSFWPGLPADLLRSRALQQLPELGWMSVNVCGSRAIVQVREREEKPLLETETGEESLFASSGGVVRRISVLSGRAEVQAGEPVTAGQLLVTAIPGQGRARGSVTAETWRELIAVRPALETEKDPGRWRYSRFALIFGKRRLNLYFSSGKAIDGCDKIVSEYTLGQRGLFALPIRVVRETVVPCRIRETKAGFADIAARLMTRLQSGLEGQVLEHSCTAAEKDGLLIVTLRAHCMENIALARTDGP